MYILLSDLHLTTNPLDEYRWKWLEKFTEWLKNYKPKTNLNIVILGDITENKDRHSNILVNRFINFISSWIDNDTNIIILSGNHDGVDVSKPFFRFLNKIRRVTMIIEPTVIDRNLFLPHAKNPVKDWEELSELDLNKIQYIFMHQAVNEAKTSSGFEVVSSISSDYFKGTKAKIISGDIHVPQVVDNVTYVGSPYPVYFGDNFKGRFMTIDTSTNSTKGIHIPSISKIKVRVSSLEELKKVNMNRGDQVSMEYVLDNTEHYKWSESRDKIRTYLRGQGVTTVSLELIIPKSRTTLRIRKGQHVGVRSDEYYIKEYSKRNKLDDYSIEVANNILNEVKETT
jgi:DNA repair exonuclease SbcCD nuclease subunit